jgi:hypothetical protein
VTDRDELALIIHDALTHGPSGEGTLSQQAADAVLAHQAGRAPADGREAARQETLREIAAECTPGDEMHETPGYVVVQMPSATWEALRAALPSERS